MALQRGNRWQGSVGRDGQRVRCLFLSEAEAAKWEATQKHRIALGLPIERPNGEAADKPQAPGPKKAYSTLGQLVELASIGWSRKKAPWERELLGRQLIEFYGADKPIESLMDIAEQQKIVDHYEANGRSAQKINHLLTVLGTLKRHAVAKGTLPVELLAQPIQKLIVEPKERPYIQDDQEQHYLKAILSLGLQDYYDLTCVWRDTGARLHEPLHTTWSNWRGRQVTFLQTKTTTPRTVPVAERVLGIIARRRETLRTETGPFKGIDKVDIRKWYEATNKAAKMEVTPHHWRHTFISFLIEKHIDLATVQKLAGHKDIKTTLRYTHHTAAGLEVSAELLDARNTALAGS